MKLKSTSVTKLVFQIRQKHDLKSLSYDSRCFPRLTLIGQKINMQICEGLNAVLNWYQRH